MVIRVMLMRSGFALVMIGVDYMDYTEVLKQDMRGYYRPESQDSEN